MSERSSAPSSPDRGRTAAIVVAGGDGSRMASGTDGVRKQYAMLGDRPVLAWAVRPFSEHALVGTVVVVLPSDDAADPPAWLVEMGVVIAAGGSTRGASVRSGLRALPTDTRLVMVHDGARPFVSAALIDRVLADADGAAVVPALAATDTLKEVGEGRVVLSTIDRGRVWHAQTPQAFPFPALLAAHAEAEREGWEATDDAGLFERIGEPVRVVEGDAENLKITRPFDLEVARLIAARRHSEPRAERTRHGS